MTDPTEQAKAHFFEGNALFEAGQLNEAAARYQAALALVPGRPSILANLGVTQCRLGQWTQAVTTLSQATKADPAHRDAWIALGLSHEALSHWSEAAHALHQGIRLGANTGQLWLSLAMCRMRLQQPVEALHALDQAVAIEPTLAEAWSQRGSLMRDTGRHAEAARCYEQALAHGGDESLNRFYLASVRGDAAPAHPPSLYVEALFDEYADDFQTHLVEQLNYQAHNTLLAPLRASGQRFERVLDLGCGTGLCGRLIQAQAGAVDGVDLSGAMVAQARASGVYRRVVHGDLLAFLRESAEPVDLVMAADVFIYVGALDAVFEAVRERLQPGACFAFSVELAGDGSKLKLLPSLRYAHSPTYIDRLAALNGFRVRQSWQAPLREDQGQPVMGLYVLMEPVASA
ncbi:tetratricopeptide repeat protein [Hydrogenophaga sp. PBL-H3]|uniref:tetratricopeptide repeat protein n=1 Tax=Hydrogenophaga sp. PBL-H3 TaxID=434010 RepID=UPI00131F96AC|nr:tetratricopeptide repeat protein [Hydrogenophaga sp. PBL-H3]QHE75178.1 tetratricopeptide repeat protein [Hydrogenophaga sp. PBL-H3]QHE79605.1 tetratricopeptide repeat protein [Hydrogenophaga sp. PBL-H3]